MTISQWTESEESVQARKARILKGYKPAPSNRALNVAILNKAVQCLEVFTPKPAAQPKRRSLFDRLVDRHNAWALVAYALTVWVTLVLAGSLIGAYVESVIGR